MPIGEDSTRDQSRILERTEPKHEIHPFHYVIDPTVCDKDLDSNIRIGGLEPMNQRYQ